MQIAHGIDEGEVSFSTIGNGILVVENEKRIDHVALA